MAKSTGTTSVAALIKGLLESSNAKAVEQIVSVLDDSAIEKAARAMGGAEHIPDLWTEGELHGHATAEQVKVGPETAATGGETEHMNRTYSNNAPQKGVQLDAEKFMRALSALGATSKAHTEVLGHIMEALKAQHSTLASLALQKGAQEEDDEEEDEEESEVVEINAAKARDLIGKARKLIKSAAALTAKAEEMEEGEEEEAKGCRKAAKAKRREAATLLAKARTHAYAASDAVLKSDIRTLAAKADINVVQEEEEDEEEEEGDAKAHEPAEAKVAAKTDDKGHQADHQDSSNGNQAAATKSEIQMALDGTKALELKLNQLIDVVAGKSRIGSVVPESVIKANMDNLESVDTKIVIAQEKGNLTGEEVVVARGISQMMGRVKAGTMDMTIVKAKLEKAPASVRDLFAQAA